MGLKSRQGDTWPKHASCHAHTLSTPAVGCASQETPQQPSKQSITKGLLHDSLPFRRQPIITACSAALSALLQQTCRARQACDGPPKKSINYGKPLLTLHSRQPNKSGLLSNAWHVMQAAW